MHKFSNVARVVDGPMWPVWLTFQCGPAATVDRLLLSQQVLSTTEGVS